MLTSKWRLDKWATKKKNRDPYNGLLQSLCNWVVFHPLHNPTNSRLFKSAAFLYLAEVASFTSTTSPQLVPQTIDGYRSPTLTTLQFPRSCVTQFPDRYLGSQGGFRWVYLRYIGDQNAWEVGGSYYMGVSKNRGTPKWWVYNGKPYWNGWFGGTIIFGNIHIGKLGSIRVIDVCTSTRRSKANKNERKE